MMWSIQTKERGASMKTTLAQIAFLVNKIDPRQKQLIYFAMLLAGLIIMRSPSDGGTGPY
jgi:hypothetical protein